MNSTDTIRVEESIHFSACSRCARCKASGAHGSFQRYQPSTPVWEFGAREFQTSAQRGRAMSNGYRTRIRGRGGGGLDTCPPRLVYPPHLSPLRQTNADHPGRTPPPTTFRPLNDSWGPPGLPGGCMRHPQPPLLNFHPRPRPFPKLPSPPRRPMCPRKYRQHRLSGMCPIQSQEEMAIQCNGNVPHSPQAERRAWTVCVLCF